MTLVPNGDDVEVVCPTCEKTGTLHFNGGEGDWHECCTWEWVLAPAVMELEMRPSKAAPTPGTPRYERAVAAIFGSGGMYDDWTAGELVKLIDTDEPLPPPEARL